MKKAVVVILSLLFLAIFVTCKTAEKQPESEGTKTEIKAGWSDPDTYTVIVTDENEEQAKEKARHKILMDIVKVRVLKQSPYTDIKKISLEFEKPLKEGKVVKREETGSGIKIYFQIRDKGLKKKFERQ